MPTRNPPSSSCQARAPCQRPSNTLDCKMPCSSSYIPPEPHLIGLRTEACGRCHSAPPEEGQPIHSRWLLRQNCGSLARSPFQCVQPSSNSLLGILLDCCRMTGTNDCSRPTKFRAVNNSGRRLKDGNKTECAIIITPWQQ